MEKNYTNWSIKDLRDSLQSQQEVPLVSTVQFNAALVASAPAGGAADKGGEKAAEKEKEKPKEEEADVDMGGLFGDDY